LQYSAHYFAKGSIVFGRCAVLVTVIVVWIYAEILTAAGAYNERGPVTQFTCRTDRSGIIEASPWYANCEAQSVHRSLMCSV